MRLGLGSHLQQAQRLAITPELRQAIALLQLPVAELGSFIEQELLENPCLDAEPKEEELGEQPKVEELIDYLGHDERSGTLAADTDDQHGVEAMASVTATLHDYLMAQLRLTALKNGEFRIGEFLVYSLDDRGYLTLTVNEAAQRLGESDERVLPVLEVILGFDPAGVGARSLQECLQVQWKRLGGGNPLVSVLIDRFLDDLGEGRIGRIAEELGVPPAAVQEAFDLIRALDPKPGRWFGRPNETRYVVPDVTIQRVGHEYVVLVNEAPVPRLAVSGRYRRMLSKGVDAETRRFLEHKIHAALWFIKALEQRRLTLLKVSEAIVRFQRLFFDLGVRHLKPLTQREVATEVGVHESTVSRAVAGKYAQTPQGTLELKYFFSSGVEGASGEGLAAESVKRMIADLIGSEDPAEPLSDQALADRLGTKGVRISRRTVAKYREGMAVPNSGRRRRYT